MGYREKGIVQIVCELEDTGKIIYQNKRKMQTYRIPSDHCKKIVYITGQGVQFEYSMELIKKVKEGYSLDADEYEKGKEIEKSELEYEIVDVNPEIIYTDITETEMFGFPEISKNVLTSSDNGLWAFHGLRKLKFKLKNLEPHDDDWKITAVLFFNKKDNEEIPPIKMSEIQMPKKHDGDCDYELYVYVDTNKLGEQFDLVKQKILFSGYLQIDFSMDASGTGVGDRPNDVSYCFPVELLLNNTNYVPGQKLCMPLQSNNTVSIDFGTSSSCVAVKGDNNIELLTLSAKEEEGSDINIYENPTCVMIHRWREIYEQWRLDNLGFPILTSGKLEEEKLENKRVEFDFGYSVKDCLESINDRELNAVLTEIKMIPKMLQEGIQTFVRPSVEQDKKTIEIVDSYEAQNDEKLDIVAFYGYILGKAINRVEKNKIYTKFQITYPVKFNQKVREKMSASLEYGLRRSIPLHLRDAKDKKGKPIFRVEAKYSEPVAYIGSVCGKYLKIDESSRQAQLFAVYDFGGGTLDYSFGIFAMDPDDEFSSNIYILGVDGDSNIGGELLIKRMSYWIYKDEARNSKLRDEKIPFEKPIGETLPDGYPEELFNHTASAKSNVRKMNESITRKIFENRLEDGSSVLGNLKMPVKKSAAPTSGSKKIKFIDLNDNSIEIEVAYDPKMINEELEKILRQTVSGFKDSMIRTFEDKADALRECGIDSFNLQDVHIFKAGNSSRNKILEQIMGEEFPGNEILLVDETSEDFMETQSKDQIEPTKYKQIAITPKTAVAFGQLKLSDYCLIDSYMKKGAGNAPFNWYVGVIDRGSNQFKMKIDKVNPEMDWIKYGRINSADMKVYYAEIKIENADDPRLKNAELADYLDEENIHQFLYIKIKDSDIVLGCICERGAEPDEMSETFEILLK